MTAFKDYIQELLTRPFRKEKGFVIKDYSRITGYMLDDLKASIFRLRRQWLVTTASDRSLQMLGAERGIFRYEDEPLEIFRNRVQAAYELYALGGTRPGMIRALQALGYEQPVITERTPSWSRFLISLPVDLGNGFTPDEWQRLRRMVWLMKPAHTIPDYTIHLNPEVQSMPLTSGVQIDGEIAAKWDFWWLGWNLYRLDGSLRLDGSITLGDGWYETAILLDGSQHLNGTSLLDGMTRLYDDWRWDNNVMNRSQVIMNIIADWYFYGQILRTYRLDGGHRLDGSVTLGSGWHEAPIYLDGTLRLDGGSLLDGITRQLDEWRWESNMISRSNMEASVIAENSHEYRFEGSVEYVENGNNL